MRAKMVFAFQKVKSRMGIRALLAHNLRIDKPKNADEQREKLNIYHKDLGKDIGRTMLAYQKNLKGHKPRKNAVWAHEYVISASPEKMENMTRREQEIFFRDSLRFITKKYGKESLVIPSAHFDEITPHLHILVQPMHKGKLNGKHFTGGSKHEMRNLRKKFHKDVAEKHGLEYGVTRSPENKPKQTDLKEYYDLVNKDLPEVRSELTQLTIETLSKKTDLDELTREVNQLNEQKNALSGSVSDLKGELERLDTLTNNAKHMTRQALTEAIDRLDQDETYRPTMRR